MSFAEAITVLDLADADATRPAAIAPHPGSSSGIALLKGSILQKDVVAGTGGGDVIRAVRTLSWQAGKTLEATIVQGSVFWGPEGTSRTAQMDQLEQTQAEVRELAQKIEELARSVDALAFSRSSDAAAFLPQPVSGEAVQSATEPERLAELFDLIVDNHLGCPLEAIAAAKDGISSADSELRAASGRLLSITEPTLARDLLPAAIQAETDPMTAAILRGALRAAK